MSDTAKASIRGNTNFGRQRKIRRRSRNYGPNTWNNYDEEDLKDLILYCKEKCTDYTINREKGKSGTKHLQFCMKFKNAVSFWELKKRFPKVHWEIAKKWKNVNEYCSKKDTRIGATITKSSEERKLPSRLQEAVLKMKMKIFNIVETRLNERIEILTRNGIGYDGILRDLNLYINSDINGNYDVSWLLNTFGV